MSGGWEMTCDIKRIFKTAYSRESILPTSTRLTFYRRQRKTLPQITGYSYLEQTIYFRNQFDIAGVRLSSIHKRPQLPVLSRRPFDSMVYACNLLDITTPILVFTEKEPTPPPPPHPYCRHPSDHLLEDRRHSSCGSSFPHQPQQHRKNLVHCCSLTPS